MREIRWAWSSAMIVMLCFMCGKIPAAMGQEDPTTRNLLTNGSFEKGLEGWALPAQGKRGTVTIDPKEKHGAFPVLRIDNPTGFDTFVRTKATVTPQTRYRLSGFVRTKQVEPVRHGGKDGASLSVGGGSFEKTPPVAGNKSWTKVTREFTTGQESEIEIGPRLGFFSGEVTGTAWFAEISLVELGKSSR